MRSGICPQMIRFFFCICWDILIIRYEDEILQGSHLGDETIATPARKTAPPLIDEIDRSANIGNDALELNNETEEEASTEEQASAEEQTSAEGHSALELSETDEVSSTIKEEQIKNVAEEIVEQAFNKVDEEIVSSD